MTKIKKLFNKLKKFFKEDIYYLDQSSSKLMHRLFMNSYRIIVFAITDFIKDDCTIRAAALTYLLTLSFIPTLLVGLFILRIFNIYQNTFIIIFDWMKQNAPFYEPVVRQILNMADNTNLSRFGIIGMISTIVSASLILHNIKNTLGKIWRVRVKTSIPRIIANYIALIVLIPVSIGISFTLITYTSINLHNLPTLIRILLSWVSPIISMFVLILFSYVLVPQTKVNWSNAAISSFLVAISIISLFSIYFKLNLKNYNQLFDNEKYKIEYVIKEINHYNDDENINKEENINKYDRIIDIHNIKLERINYVIKENDGNILGAKTYIKEAISTNILNFTNFSPNIYEQLLKYGFIINDTVVINSENNMLTSIGPAKLSSATSFAQIPVVLLLLYIIWIIILFGAELTYSIQYFRSYGIDKNNTKLSFAEKEVMALEFMHIIASRFINKNKTITIHELAKELKTAPVIINEISDPLEKSMYVIKIVNGSNISYSLACQPESITIGDIIYTLKMDGGFRNKNTSSNYIYKNIIFKNKAISSRDYNKNLLSVINSKLKK